MAERVIACSMSSLSSDARSRAARIAPCVNCPAPAGTALDRPWPRSARAPLGIDTRGVSAPTRLRRLQPGDELDRSGYELEIDETFEAPWLNDRLWIPFYLPHWSSRAASAARFTVGGGSLRLRIDGDQRPW